MIITVIVTIKVRDMCLCYSSLSNVVVLPMQLKDLLFLLLSRTSLLFLFYGVFIFVFTSNISVDLDNGINIIDLRQGHKSPPTIHKQ